jgi:SPP1 gp7 family putative phage head morphogenesis protein
MAKIVPVKVKALDPAVVKVAQEAREASIQLVENAARVYAKQVREVFQDPETIGMRVEDLQARLLARGNVSESRAELIARDQTLKLAGAINQARQEAAGVERYVWSTSGDERVRDEHQALDGQTFSWDSPPEPGHPGEDIQCRCIALPIIAELEGDAIIFPKRPAAPPKKKDPRQGPQGPPGPRGTSGGRGPAGPPGPPGDPGGPPGPQGPPGETGPAGPEGPQGPPGNDGADGADGAPGAAGATGGVGPAGPAGPEGPQGPPGNDGADGADGAPGNDGAVGPAGPTGPAGPEGPEGPQGPPGDTGPAGATGGVGPQGPTGLTGPQGPPGNDGAAGAAGADGDDGAPGADGADGRGFNPTGAWSGATNYAVDDIATSGGSVYRAKTAHSNQAPPNATHWELWASKGDQGIQGIQGNPGVDGDDGAPGAPGADGDDGAPGAPGADGDDGRGFNPRGAHNGATAYVVDDIVTLGGSTYRCVLGHTGQAPPNVTYWELWASKGDTGDTGNTGNTGPSGLGVGVANGTYTKPTVVVSGGQITSMANAADKCLATRAAIGSAIANAETRVIGVAIPANTLAVGDVLRFTSKGVMSNTTTATTSVFRIRLTPTTLTNPIVASFSQAMGTVARTNEPWSIDAEVTIISIGASGTAIGQVSLTIRWGALQAAPTTAITAAVTINTTVQLQAELTAISGGATTTYTPHTGTIELVRV